MCFVFGGCGMSRRKNLWRKKLKQCGHDYKRLIRTRPARHAKDVNGNTCSLPMKKEIPEL